MEEFLMRVAPDATSSWEGASPAELKAIEAYAGSELPAFYKWFLLRMGHHAGSLDRYFAPFYARAVINAYEEGVAESEPPLLFIARMDDPMLPLDLFYDLSHPSREDARLVRRVGGEEAPTAETLREWLAWIAMNGLRINPMAQRCSGSFRDDNRNAAAQLASALPSLGFTSPIPTGDYCALYEGTGLALAGLVDVRRRLKHLLPFDLGGPDAGTLRRLLGDVTSHTGMTVSISDWTPALPE